METPKKIKTEESDVFGQSIIMGTYTPRIGFQNQRTNEEESSEQTPNTPEQAQTEEFLGKLNTQIVGIRYYRGLCFKDEMVFLKREPTNAYDRNAIRVDNSRNQQIGHIPRDTAKCLAPLLDSKLVDRVQALVQEDRHSKTYNLGLVVKFYSSPQKIDEIHSRNLTRGLNLELVELDRFEIIAAERKRKTEEFNKLLDEAKKLDREDPQKLIEKLGADIKDIADIPLANQPKNVITPLLTYQLQGLWFMMEKENPVIEENKPTQFWIKQNNVYKNTLTNFGQKEVPKLCKGGFLCDEMGLGKTLQAIALIVHDLEVKNEEKIDDVETSDDDDYEEFGDDDDEFKIKVKDEFKITIKEEFDIKVKNESKMNIKNEIVANVQDDEIESINQFSKCNLLVCPLSVISNWCDQIEQHVKPNVCKYYVCHGPNRRDNPAFLEQFDVIITTYGTLNSYKEKQGLKAIKYKRVFLDEGHLIRNRKTQINESCSNLVAQSRWVLSGTPIQNSVEDIHALLKFLHYEPIDNHDIWKSCIGKPIKNNEPFGWKKLKMLVSSISLRRTKDMKFNDKPIIDLPPCTIYLHKIDMNNQEKQEYDQILKEAKELFQDFQDPEEFMTYYNCILQILTRLRQACNHASLVANRKPIFKTKINTNNTMNLDEETKTKLINHLKENLDEDCPICLDSLTSPIITLCAHLFCKDCILRVISNKPSCPMCRNVINSNALIDLPPEPVVIEDEDGKLNEQKDKNNKGKKTYLPSSKIEALVKFLDLTRAKNPSTKSVIFSQWTSMLDLIEPVLTETKLQFVRLDGSMNRKQRQNSIEEFKNSNETNVFLCSLKAASLGLNLTEATQVFLLDPWWNPHVEMQAIDRIYRLGQNQPVSVFRFVCKETIEERVITLQERKKELALKVMSEKERQENVRKERIRDLQLIFGIKPTPENPNPSDANNQATSSSSS